MNPRTIAIKNLSHFFRAESQVANEAKGGYLSGEIQIPSSAIGSDLEFDLTDICGNPHPNKLFVTAVTRNKVVM